MSTSVSKMFNFQNVTMSRVTLIILSFNLTVNIHGVLHQRVKLLFHDLRIVDILILDNITVQLIQGTKQQSVKSLATFKISS